MDAVLCVFTRPDGSETGIEVLLGQKQRGLFKDKLVLPGGQTVDSDYSPQHTASREAEEETGLFVPPPFWDIIGSLSIDVYDETKSGDEYIGDERMVKLLYTHTNARRTTESLPANTPELHNLQWLPEDQIPYDQTPQDYKIWLPKVLSVLPAKACLVWGHLEQRGDTFSGDVYLGSQDERPQLVVF